MRNGQGKHWYDDGDMYIGQYEDDDCATGKLYELQEDGMYTLFEIADG